MKNSKFLTLAAIVAMAVLVVTSAPALAKEKTKDEEIKAKYWEEIETRGRESRDQDHEGRRGQDREGRDERDRESVLSPAPLGERGSDRDHGSKSRQESRKDESRETGKDKRIISLRYTSDDSTIETRTESREPVVLERQTRDESRRDVSRETDKERGTISLRYTSGSSIIETRTESREPVRLPAPSRRDRLGERQARDESRRDASRESDKAEGTISLRYTSGSSTIETRTEGREPVVLERQTRDESRRDASRESDKAEGTISLRYTSGSSSIETRTTSRVTEIGRRDSGDRDRETVLSSGLSRGDRSGGRHDDRDSGHESVRSPGPVGGRSDDRDGDRERWTRHGSRDDDSCDREREKSRRTVYIRRPSCGSYFYIGTTRYIYYTTPRVVVRTVPTEQTIIWYEREVPEEKLGEEGARKIISEYLDEKGIDYRTGCILRLDWKTTKPDFLLEDGTVIEYWSAEDEKQSAYKEGFYKLYEEAGGTVYFIEAKNARDASWEIRRAMDDILAEIERQREPEIALMEKEAEDAIAGYLEERGIPFERNAILKIGVRRVKADFLVDGNIVEYWSEDDLEHPDYKVNAYKEYESRRRGTIYAIAPGGEESVLERVENIVEDIFD